MVEITQYALKGQKLIAQGIALGNWDANLPPCKVGCSKSINFPTRFFAPKSKLIHTKSTC